MRNIKGYCQMLTESRAQRALDDALIEDIVAGDIEGCRDLLLHGASPDAKNTKSLSRMNMKDTNNLGLNLLELNMKGYSALQVAILSLNYDIIKLLLKNGASVNHTGPYGWSTLGMALDKIRNTYKSMSPEDVDMVKALIRAGASASEKFNVGPWESATALHIVASMATEAREIIRLLVDEGADPNAVATYKNDDGSTEKKGGTPLSWMMNYWGNNSPTNGSMENAKELIAKGANPLLEFDSPGKLIEFFDGDISWMPEEVRSKLERVDKTKSLFKR